MTTFTDFKTFNQYIGAEKPLDNDIDMGYYEPVNMLLKSEPVMIDFYIVSFKINFTDKTTPDAQPKTAVFLNSPEMAFEWNVEPTFSGMYLHISKKIIEENRFLFKNYLDYGQHEALFLNENELNEISTLFNMMIKYYHQDKQNWSVLLPYVNVLLSLVEAFYKRQFSTDTKQYNQIVINFQQSLKDYYNQPVNQMPNVQYFADKLGLTPNYFGDIIKHFTQKSAIENIHEFVIKKAKELLERKPKISSAEVAYELGFEYPTYFTKLFKKKVNLTPKEYQLKSNNQ
ncbi:helix-turn-helix domain-containing protein [Flavobacterium pectinovorum]|uniref:helix-turn-helix domain-containing protein n=1 Tax=Flavobacterium pectinovorum TaxID=29533 RepID=UPI001FAC1327|nr:helix-turn-helix domain-containing protein [Flavobacterium pectinovorum]MCI9844576.1 AraC family transcriptional regulator [Flavobacterium pectinovorum]